MGLIQGHDGINSGTWCDQDRNMMGLIQGHDGINSGTWWD